MQVRMSCRNVFALSLSLWACAAPYARAAEAVAAGNRPVFALDRQDKRLSAGKPIEVADRPELRLRPGLEMVGRFRLDAHKNWAQTLAMKDGEYLLRVENPGDGGYLGFFVQIEGKWEGRLRGPVVKTNTWYDVRAAWTGQSMEMTVNGETFSQPRLGRINPGAKPLQVGAIAGELARLDIFNPSLERAALLASLPAAASAPAQKAGPGFFSSLWSTLFGGYESQGAPCVVGGPAAWDGWQPRNGAAVKADKDALTAEFPDTTAMLVSPALSVDLGPYPFLCLDVDAGGRGVTGTLDFTTDTGSGSISFLPQSGGRPTVVSGTMSDAWTGKLRRLAVSFAGTTGPVRVRRLALADRPVGTPVFYVRSLAAGRAKLRPGREESVVAGIQNVGGETEGIVARLEVPKGITLIGGAKRRIEWLGMDDFDLVTWRIRAARPGTYTVRVTVSAKGATPSVQDLALTVEPCPGLPQTGYVPAPQPAKTDYISLMHYCALWKEGTHWGWKRIEPWPEKRPAIGWYDEGTPEVADWHIKMALEHGINGFIYCWYRDDFEPTINQSLGHAIHEGLYNAKYRDAFTFTIMWENGCAKGVKNEADLLDNVLPFWIKNYFTHPSYLKIENKPVLFVWQPRVLLAELGGAEKTKVALDKMREQCRQAGFSGLRVIACMDAANAKLGADIAASGWDAVTGYGLSPAGVQTAGEDPAGLSYRDHADVLSRYRQTWLDRDASTGDVPDIPNVVMGRDDRPWGRVKRGVNNYIKDPKAENFEVACREAKALVDAKPAGRWDSKIVVFDNWTEFGEGHYIEPTTGTGFTFVNAIKRVFCSAWAPEAVTDIIPEDVGLPPPQKRYEAVRAGFGDRMPWQSIRITGDLLADWTFEATTQEGLLADASPNRCHLACEGVTLEDGRGGRVLRCGEGGATATVPAPFFSPGGVTVALWCKPSEKAQSDRWMLNTVSGGSDGYRLGLGGGRVAWQVPRERWSHSLISPEALPVEAWSHVAATFDNTVMRLYVNGKEVGTLERRGFINPGDGIIVGAHGVDLERARFRGCLDNVRIYRRVLTADEIAKLAAEM
ncbi:MAG: glycoside hydrolase family 99-like domain-containing protein [Kiritimatiellae bacterium]|nr:glycoside hydrolase family 99-like domain-containing protein [Kiritimatiellia bacterium]